VTLSSGPLKRTPIHTGWYDQGHNVAVGLAIMAAAAAILGGTTAVLLALGLSPLWMLLWIAVPVAGELVSQLRR
jgi:fatty acid desaturase